MEITAKISYTI